MSTHERPTLNERKLRAPLLSFSLEKEIKKLKSETAWKNGDRNAVTLQKNARLRVVLISLRKGVTLKDHKVEGPITLSVISGKIRFITSDKKVSLGANEMVVLEKAITHDVKALEESVFILTIIQASK